MIKINKKIKALSDLEWTTCWMSVRYACGRMSIASAILPQEILQEYYNRMSEIQKSILSRDVRSYLNSDPKYNLCDKQNWAKFCNALDVKKQWRVKLKDKSECVVFDIEEFTGCKRIYPLSNYIKNPYIETYVWNKDIFSHLNRKRIA